MAGMSKDNLLGADVLVFGNGDVSVTGTDSDFPFNSLVRGKGVDDDWAKAQYRDQP